MTAKKTDAQFKKELNEIHNGTIECLDVYKTSGVKLQFHCKTCNTDFEATPFHIVNKKHPTGCPKCSRKKATEKQSLNKNDIIDRINKEGNNEYEIIDWMSYKNVRDKVKFRHKTCGNEFEMTINNFFNGQRCPKHRYDLPQKFKCKGGDYYINNLKEKCIDLDEYEILEPITHSEKKFKIKHKICGHEYDVTYCKFMQGRRCPLCANYHSSNATRQITKYLKEKDIKFTMEKTFDDLRSPDLDFLLRIDFYLEDFNIAIEYDGEYHDQDIVGKERLERQQMLDKVKDEYCEANNIPLYRIHYRDKSSLKQKLDEILDSTTISSLDKDEVSDTDENQ